MGASPQLIANPDAPPEVRESQKRSKERQSHNREAGTQRCRGDIKEAEDSWVVQHEQHGVCDDERERHEGDLPVEVIDRVDPVRSLEPADARSKQELKTKNRQTPERERD